MADLPAKPSLDHLRRQARDLLRAAQGGDAAAAGRIRTVSDALTLANAQLAVAREYGFASWPRLRDEVAARTASLARQAAAFCEASIRDGSGRAARMLAAAPEIARYSFATAVILGDAGRVRTELGRGSRPVYARLRLDAREGRDGTIGVLRSTFSCRYPQLACRGCDVTAADSRPQVAATASSPGSTAMRDSQLVSSSRRCWPQLRISADLASSPKVTKVISGSRPIMGVASGPASVPLRSRQATSVSKTARSTAEDQTKSRRRSAQVRARNSSTSSSDSKVSAASSSRERIGRVPFAASNCGTDRLGRAAVLPASLSALDVLTGTTLLSAACLSCQAH